jgi:hypothetical protein
MSRGKDSKAPNFGYGDRVCLNDGMVTVLVDNKDIANLLQFLAARNIKKPTVLSPPGMDLEVSVVVFHKKTSEQDARTALHRFGEWKTEH